MPNDLPRKLRTVKPRIRGSQKHADPSASASVLHASWDPKRSTEDVRSQAPLEGEGTLSETVVSAMGTKGGTATDTKVDEQPSKKNKRISKADNRHILRKS